MEIHQLKPRTPRKSQKRVGRGGKRGTTSGGGTKGQKGRAGASVKPGFRGGDNRIWQLFPKQRGATKKHGNSKTHRKHRLYGVKRHKAVSLDLNTLNSFQEGQVVNPQFLVEKGYIETIHQAAKILSNGTLKRRVTLENIAASKAAKEQIEKLGGSVISK